jgi:hypothetical protein
MLFKGLTLMQAEARGESKTKKIIWTVDPYGDAIVQASAASQAHSLGPPAKTTRQHFPFFPFFISISL